MFISDHEAQASLSWSKIEDYVNDGLFIPIPEYIRHEFYTSHSSFRLSLSPKEVNFRTELSYDLVSWAPVQKNLPDCGLGIRREEGEKYTNTLRGLITCLT